MDGIGRFLNLVIVVIKHLSQEFLPTCQSFSYLRQSLHQQDSLDSAVDDIHLPQIKRRQSPGIALDSPARYQLTGYSIVPPLLVPYRHRRLIDLLQIAR